MKKYGKIFLTLLLIGALLILTLYSKTAGKGVKFGLQLSVTSLLPALFPSMVLCAMIGSLAEFIPLPPAITIWITSHLCGFPLGIRTVVQGYQRGLLGREQALRLTACCSNASPAFLITYIGEGVLKNKTVGLCLFLGQLLLSLFLSILLGVFEGKPPKEPQDKSLLFIITESISSAALGSLTLVGYITAFAVLAEFLKGLPIFSYLYPFLELCGGLGALPQGHRLFWAAAAAGFSGLSVMLQNASYLITARLSAIPMFLGKCFYGIVLPALILGLCSPKRLLILLFLLPFFTIFRKALTNHKKKGIIIKNSEKR